MALRKSTESLSENGRISARCVNTEVTSPYAFFVQEKQTRYGELAPVLSVLMIQLENSWTGSDYIWH
jgi:hypothetical protein